MKRLAQRLWHSGCRWLWLSGLVWAADQFSKQWITQQLAWQARQKLFPGFDLVHVYNPGAAFSLLANQPAWQWLLIVMAIAICGWLFWELTQQPTSDWLPHIAYTLIIGGALGNLTDRYRYGAVLDFIDIYINHWHWPAFNLADSAICLGCGLLLWKNVQKRY
ncbi:MAG: signal peptidase II [Candidatus Symbiodolus clandestinus]